jgi:negative regulator of sigma E activity
MTQTHEFAEQLSAFMDGELSEEEARFLLRRLEHDVELRAAWTRMQLASNCLRSQPWRPMDEALAGRVAASLADAPAGKRGNWMRWAVAASVLALGLLMAPHLRQATSAPIAAPLADANPLAPSANLVATPASADLVAAHPAARAAGAVAASGVNERTLDEPLVAAVEPSDRASPVPLKANATDSPTDFPLVDTGEQRQWPRSELVNASSDPSIEAYLVRHNQMIAEDGLGGFVPYVDVVSNQQPAANADDAAAAAADAAQENDGQ